MHIFLVSQLETAGVVTKSVIPFTTLVKFVSDGHIYVLTQFRSINLYTFKERGKVSFINLNTRM